MIYREKLNDFKEAILLDGPGHGMVYHVTEEKALPPHLYVPMSVSRPLVAFDNEYLNDLRSNYSYYLNRVMVTSKGGKSLTIPLYEGADFEDEATSDYYQDSLYYRLLDVLQDINDRPGGFVLLGSADFAYFRARYMVGELMSEENEHRVKFGRTDILEVQTMSPGDMYVSP